MYQKYPPLKWSCIYVPHNLGICTILRLHCAFLETACNSWDCAIAIRKHNRLMGWEWLSWLMEGSWELSEMVMDALNGGNPQVLGSLGARTQTKGKGVSLSRWTSQKSLVWGGLSTCLTWWQWSCKSCSLPLYTMETRVMTWVLNRTCVQGATQSQDCVITPSVQSRDWHAVSGIWECAAQSRDGANS